MHYNRRQLASSHRKPPVSESTKHCEISDPKSITWFCKRIMKVFSHVVSFCTFDGAEFLLCIHLTLRTWHGLLSYLVSSRQIKSLKCMYPFHKGNTCVSTTRCGVHLNVFVRAGKYTYHLSKLNSFRSPTSH